MSTEEERAERREAFLSWKIEEELPETIGDFRLCRTDRQEGRIYHAFAYESASTGWIVEGIFDEETMDYMVKADFRLFTMTDIEIITGDFERYKKSVATLLEKNLRRSILEREKISVVVAGKVFTTWNYRDTLPETIGAYRLMVTPDCPILGLNGSYIIAEYENRERARGIVFFYNVYRNEYYAEMSAEKIPVILHEYDTTTIEKLASIIRKRLKSDLERLEKITPES